MQPDPKTPDTVPPLAQDISFWGMATTQFLGAFNDSVFKQLVLLICVASPVIASLDSLKPVPYAQAQAGSSSSAANTSTSSSSASSATGGSKSGLELPLRGTGDIANLQQHDKWQVQAEENTAYNLELDSSAKSGQVLSATMLGPTGEPLHTQVSESYAGTVRFQWRADTAGEYSVVVAAKNAASATTSAWSSLPYELRIAQADEMQAVGVAVFAVPFILFSGFAGWLADRTSKRLLVILCKVAEIVIMAAGVIAFAVLLAGGFWAILVILFMMGAQSAFFGPSKYGILPEMLHDHDLPVANGVLQTTTFMALIFGTALAGLMKDYFHGQLWIAGVVCSAIAVVGTLTSLLVRKVKIAQPGMKFSVSSLTIPSDTWTLIESDRGIWLALGVYSLFWFLGAIVQPAVNALGENQLRLSATNTSLMVASMGVGIAIGCLIAGFMSRGKVSFGVVRAGSVGMVICLGLLALGGSMTDGLLSVKMGDTSQTAELVAADSGSAWMAFAAVLCLLGVFAGFFAVPVQVYLQARPPKNQKGRMIGSMNLINWIAIFMSAGVYWICRVALDHLGLPGSAIFAVLALMMLPVAIFYRPKSVILNGESLAETLEEPTPELTGEPSISGG